MALHDTVVLDPVTKPFSRRMDGRAAVQRVNLVANYFGEEKRNRKVMVNSTWILRMLDNEVHTLESFTRIHRQGQIDIGNKICWMLLHDVKLEDVQYCTDDRKRDIRTLHQHQLLYWFWYQSSCGLSKSWEGWKKAHCITCIFWYNRILSSQSWWSVTKNGRLTSLLHKQGEKRASQCSKAPTRQKLNSDDTAIRMECQRSSTRMIRRMSSIYII